MTTPVVRAAQVQRSPEDAFRIFTEEIGAWWPLPTHGLFGNQSGGVFFEDGELVERSTAGEEVIWGEVLEWDAPKRFVISWHPGRAGDDGSEVEVVFEANGDGTRVVIEHRGWSAFGEDAVERRRSYVGPGAWGYVLDHFADGVEPRPDAPDLAPLVNAYERFFAEAERGGFGDPPQGEWNAQQVLAHVGLNDAGMLAVCQSLVHGADVQFENKICHDRDSLGGWIDSCGDDEGLIARGRQMARLVGSGIARLSQEQRETMVHCRLEHNGETMLDDVRPWGVVAIDVQAGVHLPAHIEQLENLRV
jgi:uncharacterized protein YndB with AHSA1/START domain